MAIARPTKFAHVVYRTRRFLEMLKWYQTVFDANVQYENQALAFLTYDEEHHRFAIANMSVLAPDGESGKRAEIGVDHVGYTYASIADLLENYDLLRAEGIKPYWCVHHGITVSMYYQDPDGNQMEFQVDCLPSPAEAGQYMAASFANNPVGVEFDPDDWLVQYRSSGSTSEFLKRQTDEPISPIRGYFAELVGD